MKTEKTKKTFEEYLLSIDSKDKIVIESLDELLVKRFGTDNRSIWEGVFWGGSHQTILGYGEISTNRKDKATWFMLGLSIQKNYYSLYINAVQDNQYLVKKYADELGKVKTGTSSVSFTKLENLNIEKLELIVDIAFNIWKEKNKS